MQPTDSPPPPGVVELREDAPLKAGAHSGGECGGPRLIATCFAALAAAVTVALLTQIYYGDYQVVPHGSVSGAAEACSAAGTRALKAGGRAADAAAAAALCLALLAPHRTSLDGSGCMLYLEYRSRTERAAGPRVAEWGGPSAGAGPGGAGAGPGGAGAGPGGAGAGPGGAGAGPGGAGAGPGGAGAGPGGAGAGPGGAGAGPGGAGAGPGGAGAGPGGAGAGPGGAGAGPGGAGAGPGGAGAGAEPRAPRMLVALAELHAQHGALPWRQVLQPAIDLARGGFTVSKDLAAAAADAGRAGWPAGGTRADPIFADYLESLQHNSSAELSAAWSKDVETVRYPPAQAAAAGGWLLYAGGAGAASAGRAFAAALAPPPIDADDAERRAVTALINEARKPNWPAGGVATGLAVVDSVDTYVALVTGLSLPFGSLPPWGLDGADPGAGGEGSAAAARDSPGASLDLAPAILLNDNVCGTRYVLGAESSAALAQAAAVLAADGELGAGGVERARVGVLAGGALAAEAAAAPGALPAAAPGALPAAAPGALPAPALNATRPYAAVNVVQQRGDTLASHADSRGGGLASRF